MNTINTNLGQRIKKDVFCLVVSMGQKKKFRVPMRYWVLMGTQNFSLSHTRNEMKNIFLYNFNKLKIYHLSSIQDLFHKNFIIDLAHRSLRGSVVEYRNSESKGLRFNSSWELSIFSLFHACEKMKPFSISLPNNKFTISIIPFTN